MSMPQPIFVALIGSSKVKKGTNGEEDFAAGKTDEDA